ncbi:MAG TPA: PqqD family protein [Xanthobacteraceae bacterium]|jgi:hypothetical protein
MQRYRVRDADIVSEIIDDEAIIMDLSSGRYFSAEGVGAVIWDGMVCGFDVTQIKQRILQSYALDAAGLDADFEDFADALLANKLVEAVHDSAVASVDRGMPLPAHRRKYDRPVLSRYDDMQDLTLLDPIHDVEETGWPNRKTDF